MSGEQAEQGKCHCVEAVRPAAMPHMHVNIYMHNATLVQNTPILNMFLCIGKKKKSFDSESDESAHLAFSLHRTYSKNTQT